MARSLGIEQSMEQRRKFCPDETIGHGAYVTKSGPADAVITAIREAALLAREKGAS